MWVGTPSTLDEDEGEDEYGDDGEYDDHTKDKDGDDDDYDDDG